MDNWSACELISPRLFIDFVLPYHGTVTEAAHKVGFRIILWNPGNILPVHDQQASALMDIFAFEQPKKGVETSLEAVRGAFGKNRSLRGNIDSELLLMRNDPDEINACVKEQIRQSGEGAPFIFFTGSPMLSNIEIAAVDAMVDAVRRK